MNQPEIKLPNEKLIAYQLAVEFHRSVMPLARFRGIAPLRDQLHRAADSVVLNLAEGAGAASLMAAVKIRDQLRGKKVVCVMSGGNMNTAVLQRSLCAR